MKVKAFEIFFDERVQAIGKAIHYAQDAEAGRKQLATTIEMHKKLYPSWTFKDPNDPDVERTTQEYWEGVYRTVVKQALGE